METQLATFTSTAVALAGFAFVSSITPGPNNFMLMASGAKVGFRSTLPHIFGVVAGLVGLLALSYFGVGVLVSGHPLLRDAMAWACVIYMVWLAVKMLRHRAPLKADGASTAAKALNLRQAAVFQLVNPKCWAMAVSGAATTLASGVGETAGFALLVGIFASINLPCVAVWAAWGAWLRRYLAQPRLKLAFDVTMALLMLLTAWAMAPAIH